VAGARVADNLQDRLGRTGKGDLEGGILKKREKTQL